MHMVLGPLLILVGMILLGLLSFELGGSGISDRFRRRVEGLGVWGALLLGLSFALSFCPTSAALYFGSLISLSVQTESSLLLPGVYGLGTAVPVLAFTFVIAFVAKSLGGAFDVLGKVDDPRQLANADRGGDNPADLGLGRACQCSLPHPVV